VYQIIFGLLILIAEARWSGLLKHFKFLTHFLGLGLFYIFVGGLALGSDWYQVSSVDEKHSSAIQFFLFLLLRMCAHVCFLCLSCFLLTAVR
jgi:hypothetical protein